MAEVLNITPDREIRTLREAVLAGQGYRVTSVSTKKEALIWLRSQPFDVLLLGFRMSEKSVVALVNIHKAQNPHGCVIFISKHAPSDLVKTKVDAIVHALEGPETLLKTITEICDLAVASRVGGSAVR